MTINYEEDLILLIGASGRTASFILPHLSQKAKRLRLACNSTSSHDRLAKEYPQAEAVIVNLTEPAACRALLRGVTTVFHIGPPFHPRETEIGYNVIDAAVAESREPNSRFRHFVYSSVLQSIFRKMLNHDRKRYVEEYLMETGLNWTIVQPSHMMDSMRPSIEALAVSNETQLQVTADFAKTTLFTNVMMKDLGEGVALIIEQRERHYFAMYPFVSMESPLSYEEMWAFVGEQLGKPIKVQQQSFDEALEGLAKILFRNEGDMDVDVLKAAERTLLFYNRKGLVGNSNVLGMVLGRKPTSFEDWVKDVTQSKVHA